MVRGKEYQRPAQSAMMRRCGPWRRMMQVLAGRLGLKDCRGSGMTPMVMGRLWIQRWVLRAMTCMRKEGVR